MENEGRSSAYLLPLEPGEVIWLNWPSMCGAIESNKAVREDD